MALKETFLERAGLLGCVLPTVVGGVIFAALGWWLMVPSSESEYLEGAAGSIGFCVGGAAVIRRGLHERRS